MTRLPRTALNPERKAQVFRNAVLLRLHHQLDLAPLTEEEANYLWLVEDAVERAMQAVVQTLDRVAPTA